MLRAAAFSTHNAPPPAGVERAQLSGTDSRGTGAMAPHVMAASDFAHPELYEMAKRSKGGVLQRAAARDG